MHPDKMDIFGIVILSIVLIAILLVTIINYWYLINNKLFIPRKNELSFFRQYIHYGDYSDNERFIKERIHKIIKKFKKDVALTDKISIESKFNNIYYAVFDLDDTNILELFKKLYADTPYVILQSSITHYWGFIDVEYKKITDIFYDQNWKGCNDLNYVRFSTDHNKLLIRGLYENKERKPILYEINGNLSKNFQLFIDKLRIYYNREGFELSVLRYNDPSLLLRFNRKIKLEILKK